MRAQAARSLVHPEVSHGCSQSPLHSLTPLQTRWTRQYDICSSPTHLYPDFMQYFAFYTTHRMNSQASFHRITIPILSQVPSQLRDGVWAVWAGLAPRRCWEMARGCCGMLHCERKLCYAAVQLVQQRYCGSNVCLFLGDKRWREKR